VGSTHIPVSESTAFGLREKSVAKRLRFWTYYALPLLFLLSIPLSRGSAQETIQIDATGQASRFPRFWEQMFWYKPSYYAYELLHQLGVERLANESQDAIVTKNTASEIEVAVWNIADPGQAGANKTISLAFKHVPQDARVSIQRIDEDHGNALKPYGAMGQPLDPTPD
jgi:hypothetical protein